MKAPAQLSTWHVRWRARKGSRVEALAERLAALHRTRRDLASGGTTGKDLQRLLGVLQELRRSLAQDGLEFPFLRPFLEGYLRFAEASSRRRAISGLRPGKNPRPARRRASARSTPRSYERIWQGLLDLPFGPIGNADRRLQ